MAMARQCDRCGEFFASVFSESHRETNSVKLVHKPWLSIAGELYPNDNMFKRSYYDLCPACIKEFADFLDGSVKADENGTAQG